MPTRRPANHDDLLLVHHDPSASYNSLQTRLCPGVRVAYVLDRAVDEVDLGTESVIDADGQDVVGEEVGGLIWADSFPGKRHVPAAMDHKRCK